MKVTVAGQEVVLDPKYLDVNEDTMNDFLKNFAGIYNYYNVMLSKAQFIAYLADDKYDQEFHRRFVYYKENTGGSDKLTEARTTGDDLVIKARKSAREARYISQLLQAYVRSMDKAHENALNLGYNVRREIDKIFPQSIKMKNDLPMNIDQEVEKLFAAEQAANEAVAAI